MNKVKMKLAIILLIPFLCSGCGLLLIGAGVGVLLRKSVSQATEHNRKSLSKLNLGMAKSEAIETMGTKTQRAYYEGKAINITNPYRTEILQDEEKTLEVVYYVTDVKGDDDKITDDELTPSCF